MQHYAGLDAAGKPIPGVKPSPVQPDVHFCTADIGWVTGQWLVY